MDIEKDKIVRHFSIQSSRDLVATILVTTLELEGKLEDIVDVGSIMSHNLEDLKMCSTL